MYGEIKSIDTSKIDCNKPRLYNSTLINLTLEKWVGNNMDDTAKWYPSLNEGKIGCLLLGRIENIGCTRVRPTYTTLVEFNGEIIFISETYKFLGDSRDEWLYPDEWVEGGLSVSGDISNPLVVKKKGNYTIWVMINDENKEEAVGLERINFELN